MSNTMKAADGKPIAKTVGDTVCQVCSRPNPVWFTPNAIWNAVVQPPTGVFCPVCFIVFAATKGVDPTAWVLLTEDAYERISAAEERERVLREALAEIIRDHDERDMLFPGTERQAYRVKVMDAGRVALAAPAPEPVKQCAVCKGAGVVATSNGSRICPCSEGWDNNDEG